MCGIGGVDERTQESDGFKGNGVMLEELNKDTLERLYIKEKKSLHDIARMFGCSTESIRNRCRKYDIKLRLPGREGSKERKTLRTIYLDVEQIERLSKLSEKTRVPKAVYIREALDLLLDKYENELKGRQKKRERR